MALFEFGCNLNIVNWVIYIFDGVKGIHIQFDELTHHSNPIGATLPLACATRLLHYYVTVLLFYCAILCYCATMLHFYGATIGKCVTM